MRGVEIAGMDIDAPWLTEGTGLRVNGVDVTAFVELELDRRFPGRSQRRAESPEGLREAWTTVDLAWHAAINRAAALPAGSIDVRIDDEWSFAETLRHLVHAIDVWLGKGVLGLDETDFHPLGLGQDSNVPEAPAYDDVLAPSQADSAGRHRVRTGTWNQRRGRQPGHNPRPLGPPAHRHVSAPESGMSGPLRVSPLSARMAPDGHTSRGWLHRSTVLNLRRTALPGTAVV